MPALQPPLLTIVLVFYNQQNFIESALDGVMAQTYPNLEIIVSDDASTDGGFDVVQRYFARHGQPATVVLNRNSSNLGLIGHVNKLMDMARGELVMIAAGDDVSRPDRLEKIYEAYKGTQPAPWLIHSSVTIIGQAGQIWRPPLLQSPELIDICQSLGTYIGATGVISKNLWNFFGPITEPKAYEDLVLAFRAALAGRICYVDLPLVAYRRGSGMTTQSVKRGLRPQFQAHRRLTLLTHAVLRQRLRDLRHFLAHQPCSAAHPRATLVACQDWLMATLPELQERVAYHARPAGYIRSALADFSRPRLLVPVRDFAIFRRSRRPS